MSIQPNKKAKLDFLLNETNIEPSSPPNISSSQLPTVTSSWKGLNVPFSEIKEADPMASDFVEVGKEQLETECRFILFQYYEMEIEEFSPLQKTIIHGGHYGNEEDFFHRKIDVAFKVYELFSLDQKGKNISEEEIAKKIFQASQCSFSFQAIVTYLYAFQEEFPDAFKDNNYAQDIENIHKHVAGLLKNL